MHVYRACCFCTNLRKRTQADAGESVTSQCVRVQEGSLASNLPDTGQWPILRIGPLWGCFLSLWVDSTPGLVRTGPTQTVGHRERMVWPEPTRESVERQGRGGCRLWSPSPQAAQGRVRKMEDELLGTRPQQASRGGAWPDKSRRVLGARGQSALLGSVGPWCLLEWQPQSGPPDTYSLMEGVPWERHLLTGINVPGPGVQSWGSLLLQNSENSKSKSFPGLQGERAESPGKFKPAVTWECGLCCGKSQARAFKPRDRNIWGLFPHCPVCPSPMKREHKQLIFCPWLPAWVCRISRHRCFC